MTEAEANFILSGAEAAALRDRLESEGRKLVFTNGVFDLLHVGHVRYLKQARALGDALLIALNGDESVTRLKGPGRPVNTAADRAEILCALECVDGVVVFDEERVTRHIDQVRPHLYAKGGDYSPETLNPEEKAALDRVGAEIRILSLVPGKSTSSTLQRLRDEGDDGGKKLRLGVLGSGVGSNLVAIADAIAGGELDAEIAIVLSDVEDAPILERARERGLNAVFVDPRHEKRLGPPAQKEIRDRLLAAGVDLVVLAGFMRILKEPVLGDFEGRIVNIHPSLLPAFKGLDPWGQALAAGVSESGCTVHLVNDGVDEGEVLARAVVPVEAGDTAETLRARIHESEHALYPKVIGELGEKILGNRAK